MTQILSTTELIQYYKDFTWTRNFTEVHIHHTYKPDHSNFNGSNHIQLHDAMKNYHINTNKWSDIGQHLTLYPDGKWIIGRNWNKDPASIKGRNHLGFAIEIIGNFDVGCDVLQGEQLNSICKFLRFVNKSIVFHREFANKSCPGTGLDKMWFISKIKEGENVALNINVFGKDITLEKVIMQDNLNYINLRELFDKLGCKVDWNSETNKTFISLK